MLYSEIIAVCSQIHTKLINAVSVQNLELLSVKPGGLLQCNKYKFSFYLELYVSGSV
jgi:hypothetical protein